MTIYITVIIALLLSAFFSGMEIAFVSANKLRFEIEKADNSIIGNIISLFYRHPQQYITTILVGNNIVLVIFSIKMNQLLYPVFDFLRSGALISLAISLVATIIVLFIGEYLPKTIMRGNPNAWLKAFSPMIYLIYIILYPIAWLCTFISKLLLRLVGERNTMNNDAVTFSRADLNYLVQESMAGSDHSNNDAPSENEIHILKNALDFSKVKIRDCYIPRTEIVALPYDTTTDTLKQTFQESGFSKIPIYKGDIDNIIGYIHCSEMFEHQSVWHEHINQMPLVPENMAAQKLMTTFMQQKKSIAVVVDEFGGTAGIVTLEDIMEEIFGEIQDEHDSEEYVAKQLNDSELLVSARWEVEELNHRFNLQLPEDESYDTLAGLILNQTGAFPKINEQFSAGGYKMKCLKIADNRIELVKITR
ncbi:MAG: hemolysin family protein [Paludibacter sp.]|nr:hemolysin family protein [Bacteroidales bacterium]MCM1069402.1 hemolysin family protein [Prevotella sp.]MCM1353777.1 hemolysin family protein [Bacteroides sp.]MCM1442822.1 hemolysin family protein [Muribaculum sp.]MCM1481812.1 hemolysin family protein [Paludibacter sp.]